MCHISLKYTLYEGVTLWAMTGIPNGSSAMSGDVREYSVCGCVTMPSTCAYQFLQELALLKPVGAYTAPLQGGVGGGGVVGQMVKPLTADAEALLAPIWETLAAMMPSPLSLRWGASHL